MQIKTGPFLRSPLTIERIMLDVLISLLPPVVAGIVFFGWRALFILVISTVTAVLTEALIQRAPLTLPGIFGDGSAAVTGLLVGLILPSGASWWIPAVGSFLAIALIKWAFGGLGSNIFNPALGARAILLLAFTSQMVKFVLPFDTVSGATPLLAERSFSWALFWGNTGGSIGETSVPAIVLGAVYLLYKGHINWRIPCGYLGSAFLLALLWGLDPWYTLTAGGLLFAAVFMATDMVTSPVTFGGQLLFGVGCGLLTMVIRRFTPFPEGVTFAVLSMNALAPLLESLTIPAVFGVGLSRETKYKGLAVSLGVLLALAALFVGLERITPAALPVISGGRHLPVAELLGSENYEIADEQGTVYYLLRNEAGDPEKTAFVAEQKGFNGPIRFLVVLDNQEAIQSLSILEHWEDPGLGELITRASFLNQFTGLDRRSEFSLGVDIQGITGATVSSRAFTSGLRRALEDFAQVFYPTGEEQSPWTDGSYRGVADSFGGPLEVEVTVAGNRLTAVEILVHADTPGISDRALEQIPQAIVSANAVQVEAISGATISSEAIMRAVQKALTDGERIEEAPAGLYAIELEDGVYRGRAQGFGGQLVLDVAVQGGKITEITVAESLETPFIAENAFEKMLPAIVATQGPVDGVSGATVTSGAILDALDDALAMERGR